MYSHADRIDPKQKVNQGDLQMNAKFFTGVLLLGALALPIATVSARTSTATNQQAATAASDSQIQDQDISLLRQDIRAKKKQLVAANLNLTPDEATKFWPVYDQYTADLVKINDKKYALIKTYANDWGTITDAQATDLINGALAVDVQVSQLRIRYVPIFNKVISGKKTATFFQIDRRLQDMIDLQLMGALPLVQSQQ
jgi:hypothetical protein